MYNPEQSQAAQTWTPAPLALQFWASCLTILILSNVFYFQKGGQEYTSCWRLKESNEVTHVKIFSVVPGTYKSSINSSYCYYLLCKLVSLLPSFEARTQGFLTCRTVTCLVIQSILVIYGSYVLHSHHKYWSSEYWTTAPKKIIGLGSWQHQITFSSTHQYIILFHVCFCLKTPF